MIDIDAIQELVKAQKHFEIQIVEENEADNWTLTIKKPSPKQFRKWSTVLYSKESLKAATEGKVQEEETEEERLQRASEIGINMFSSNIIQLNEVAEDILSHIVSWEGIKAGSKEAVKSYMLLDPMKAATFAIGVVSQYQDWQAGLKKSSEAE